MSLKYMCAAFSVQVGNPLRKLILLKLCDNASDQGECWPSHANIASQCEVSKRSVLIHIDALIKDGFLTSEQRFKNGQQTSNVYTICYKRLSGGAGAAGVGVQELHGGGAGDSPLGVQELHTESVSLTSQLICQLEPSRLTAQVPSVTVNKSISDYPVWFEDVWQAYPKRAGGDNKKTAFNKAKARAREGATHEAMLAASVRYKNYITLTGKAGTEYIKQAATFFGNMDNIENKWIAPVAGGQDTGYKTATEKAAERFADTFNIEKSRDF